MHRLGPPGQCIKAATGDILILFLIGWLVLVMIWLRRLSICPWCRRPRFDPWVGKIPWRRKWQPTPVLLPRKFHAWRSLVAYTPWGRKELDTTERLHSLSTSTNKNEVFTRYICPFLFWACDELVFSCWDHEKLVVFFKILFLPPLIRTPKWFFL